jgi:DNA invertase Pin-like site-specific DNA recombinase
VQRIAFSYTRFSTLAQEQGDSECRQIESARRYAAELGYILDESIAVDRGKSAFTGKNISEGALGEFIKRIEARQIPKGSILLVESPDRVSRQRFSEAYPTYQRILNAGIEIHFLSIRDVLKPNHSFTDILRVGVEIDRANAESVMKSERVGAAWTRKRQQANGKAAMSARVPAWLKAVKGQPVQAIPERVAIVKRIFEWASKGLGQYIICDKLIACGVPAWGPVFKGKGPRWTPFYVSSILSSRAVIGEYQPHTKRMVNGLRKRVADGAAVENYYPAVIPLALWQRVQEARREFAQAKFGESFNAGKDLHSGKNIFKRLLFDANNDAPMVYRHGTHPYLVTTHRKSLRQHKINYALFEKIILEFLSSADWKEIHQDGSTGATTELLAEQESLARKIEDNEKVLKRYESLIDDSNSTGFERISNKYKAAVTKSKELMEERAALETQIASQNSGSSLLFETKGIEIYRVSRTSKEDRLKLRLYLAQRVRRIDLTFGVTVLTAGPVKSVQAGEGKIVAKLKFVNGAVKWAFIDKDRAVLLW